MGVPSFPPRADEIVKSNAAGISGATEIKNIVVISQSDYDALTPDPKTLYIITS